MGMQSMGSAPARNQIRAAGGAVEPGKVAVAGGKAPMGTAGAVKSGNGHAPGSANKGFSGGVIPGFVK